MPVDALTGLFLNQGCGVTVQLGAGDAVRCNSCGSRILWKKRTKRTVVYDARNEVGRDAHSGN